MVPVPTELLDQKGQQHVNRQRWRNAGWEGHRGGIPESGSQRAPPLSRLVRNKAELTRWGGGSGGRVVGKGLLSRGKGEGRQQSVAENCRHFCLGGAQVEDGGEAETTWKWGGGAAHRRSWDA